MGYLVSSWDDSECALIGKIDIFQGKVSKWQITRYIIVVKMTFQFVTHPACNNSIFSIIDITRFNSSLQTFLEILEVSKVFLMVLPSLNLTYAKWSMHGISFTNPPSSEQMWGMATWLLGHQWILKMDVSKNHLNKPFKAKVLLLVSFQPPMTHTFPPLRSGPDPSSFTVAFGRCFKGDARIRDFPSWWNHITLQQKRQESNLFSPMKGILRGWKSFRGEIS